MQFVTGLNAHDSIFPLFYFLFHREKPYLTMFYDSIKANMSWFYRKEKSNVTWSTLQTSQVRASPEHQGGNARRLQGKGTYLR